MKPAVQKKPLQSRHRVNANVAAAAAASGQQPGSAPVVPRMLRRMTKQSFMDVDLQYLMKLDPTTPDPFENSSPVFDDPPSLFRPLPTSITGGPLGSQQQWMSAEAIARLQKEQEDLRVQYLSFLHQLNLSNPHGFLVHMNTFASEFPQEFSQLQAYIRFQEQVTNQQREEAKRVEEMRVYQAQLEERHREEQERKRAEELWTMQLREDQGQEFRRSLEEWLFRRQQQKRVAMSTSFRVSGSGGKDDTLDMADVLTIALQKDPMFVERMMANGGQGLDVMLTPAQQQEFWMFMEEKRAKDLLLQEKKRQDLGSAGLSSLFQQQGSSLFGGGGGSLSSALFGGLSNSNNGNNMFSSTSGWNGGEGFGGIGNSNGGGLFDTSNAFPSQFQPPMTQEQYLKRNRQPSNRRR